MNTPFEKRICFTLCICQMTAVLSCVSIVYLTVAIYKPAYLTLTSGFSEQPVMCTTISNSTPENCEIYDDAPGDKEKYKGWNSCSEWCLSKSSGGCPRIFVDVRHNGSDIKLEGCESMENKLCYGIDLDKPTVQCAQQSCRQMSGLFNCTSPTRIPGTASDLTFGAQCRDLTSILQCNATGHDDVVNCDLHVKNCLNLNGTYECDYGLCKRIKGIFHCKKRCIDIQTDNKTIIVREAGDRVFSAKCSKAINISSGEELWPLNYKSFQDPNQYQTLLIFCTNVYPSDTNEHSYILQDCFNGTLVEPNYFGSSTDIVTLTDAHVEHIDRGINTFTNEGLVGPTEMDLLIYNNTRLFINYESCVNTLILNECEKFYNEYGHDGKDIRGPARFQCFYEQDFDEFVVLRFSRMKTMTELMLATSIPITLAIVSCFTLVLCARIIRIGDDSHFYFQCCGADAQAVLEKDNIIMVGALGVIGNAVNRDRERRESKHSAIDEPQHSIDLKRRPTIGEILNSRHVLSVNAGIYKGSGGGYIGTLPIPQNLASPLVPQKLTIKEQIKFYISLALGILATLCVFALLFLLPLIIEPSISTLLADFDPEPAICVTTDSNLVTGLTKCSTFSSCREGCTSPPSNCYQIYVSYRKASSSKSILPKSQQNLTIIPRKELMDESKWDESYTQLFINVKGCGYPPRVQCEVFGQTYGQEGQSFHCYYSRSNPRLVVTDYNWEETAYPLIFSIFLPTFLFSISIAILSSWYCPSCEERGKHKRPSRSGYSIQRSKEFELDDEYYCSRSSIKKNNVNRKKGVNELGSNMQQNRTKSKNEISNNKNDKDEGKTNNNLDDTKKNTEGIIVNQPLRRKYSIYHPNSPSLQTISSAATTASSINSLEDGWQSPPSPPQSTNFNALMNASSKPNLSTRTRKL